MDWGGDAGAILLPRSTAVSLFLRGMYVSSCVGIREHSCRSLEPGERQFLRLAQIGPLELSLPRMIGAPVQSPTPVTCSLFVCGETAVLTAKGEGRGCLEPGIPVQRIHHYLGGVHVPLVGENSILDDWRCLSHRSLPWLPSLTEQGFPNSIAHVRESLQSCSPPAGARCSTRAESHIVRRCSKLLFA